MNNNLRIVRAHFEGLSGRKIAKQFHVSRDKVALLVAYANSRGWYTVEDLDRLDEATFSAGLTGMSRDKRNTAYKLPDYKEVHEELARPHVTLKLLWEEYVQVCRAEGIPYYMETTFRRRYHQFVGTHKLTLRLEHKPGYAMQVDWAGTKMVYGEVNAGKPQKASLFVAVLPCSRIIYAEPFQDEKQASWIAGHVNAFRYFGGLPKTLVPDNLKTGVTKPNFYDPLLNETYLEMADYYGVVILPARIRHAQDKGSVENGVLQASRRIIAALRNCTFKSFHELKQQVALALENLNERELTDGSGSRWQSYLTEEKDFMQPLPTSPYTLSEWKRAKVQVNSHVLVDGRYYSVPYIHVGETVEVRISEHTVEIYSKQERLHTHKRERGKTKYVTVYDHMPADKLFFAKWDDVRFLKWAADVGDATEAVVSVLFDRVMVKEQAYRSCFGLMGLAKKHGKAELEMTCQYVLSVSKQPTFGLIKQLLEKQKTPEKIKKRPATKPKGFTRGKDYFGGDH